MKRKRKPKPKKRPGQYTSYVNCPHCGKIIEVVAPLIDRRPKRVLPESQFLEHADAQDSVKSSCPDCQKQIWIHWSYT